MNQDFWMNKIWGSWTGKIAGGIYGMPVEGKTKEYIQQMQPPLKGWGIGHIRIINDDEQYEFIALQALESLNDEEFKLRKSTGTLLEPDYLGKFWQKHLKREYIFTAEKAAYDNARKGVPWKNAGDEIFTKEDGTKIYQNEFYDWIGAQMKGEIFGMLLPAWNWNQVQPNPENDLKLLTPCFDLSLQDALMAHRGVAIPGELFISAMISVAIPYNPYNVQHTIFYPDSDPKNPLKETINFDGICAEKIIEDIVRIKNAMLLYTKVPKSDVEIYFSFIDPVIKSFKDEPQSGDWEGAFGECRALWEEYTKKMTDDAKNRLSYDSKALNKRLDAIKVGARVHTLLNNSAIVIGLIYGDGDFFQTMRIATDCGEDTDCNAGNTAAIMGAYLGQKLIPSYFKRFIRGEIIPALKEWNEKSIENLAKRTMNQGLRFSNL